MSRKARGREGFEPDRAACLFHIIFNRDDIFEPRRLIRAQINRGSGAVHEMALHFGFNKSHRDNAAFDRDGVLGVDNNRNDRRGGARRYLTIRLSEIQSSLIEENRRHNEEDEQDKNNV